MSVCCECCEWSGTGLCDGPITRPEESYGMFECEFEISAMRRPISTRAGEP